MLAPAADAAGVRGYTGHPCAATPARRPLTLAAAGGAPVFRYRFDRAPRGRPGWFGARDVSEAGAFHAGGIPYVLDTLDAMPWHFTAADRETAAAASGYGLNFVQSGDPKEPGLPRWLSFRETGEVARIDGQCRAGPEASQQRQVFLCDLTRRRGGD